jgi:hypothetical protein
MCWPYFEIPGPAENNFRKKERKRQQNFPSNSLEFVFSFFVVAVIR